MEKITLKPSVKELVYKGSEENVHFDVWAYQGAGNQEKMLGLLFILGHIKYFEEDLSYTISLVSSLAKREYYSDESLREQNAKAAFERTLKKLNEVLEDFFQNKNFKLNIGLAVLSGDKIYISRLGKFKIALARSGKYVDILNNVDLFSKDSEGEKQFSNIISGKILAEDKIFAYFPSRSITAREKQLNDIFVKENQDDFSQKMAQLAVNTTNFSCCGVHIDMQEIKEIPISPATYTKPILSTKVKTEEKKIGPHLQEASLAQTQNKEPAAEVKEEMGQERNLTTETPEADQIMERSQIIPAEFLVSKRANIFTPIIKSLQRLVSTGRLGERARRHGFILISAVILFPILIFVLLRTDGISNEDKSAIKQAGENFKLAQSYINQNNLKDARSLLQASLANLSGISDRKIENVKRQINQTLDGIDRASAKQPELFSDPLIGSSDFKANFITSLQDGVYTSDAGGNAFAINRNEVSSLGQFKISPQFLFSTLSFIAVFNGSDIFSVYDFKSKKIEQYSLKEPAPADDAVLYEDNLYTLSNNTVYKYADAATSGIKRTVWTSDSTSPISGNLISITADGNIYALNSDGKLIKYFKGKKTGELDLQIIPSSSSRLFTHKDSAFIYLADKTNKRIYVFDKESGSLKTAYKLDLAGTIQDIFISPDGAVWLLSNDNKIWVIK